MLAALFFAGALGLSLTTTACRGGKETNKPGECGGRCGDGTKCQDGQCVVDYLAVCRPDDYDPDGGDEDNTQMRPPIDTWGQCQEDASDLPPFKPVDDSHVPQYDPNKARTLSMDIGDEQLAEDTINAHMRDVEYALNECFSRAACYNNGVFPSGTIEFVFRLEGSGQVESVKVTAPEEFNIFSAIQCARKAVYDHKFPSYDGPGMTISYAVELM
ncbi:MAG: hypothetical protein R3A51_18015 [Nannocystaceae bacterium]|nr:hypothetical protein [Myxococcales bacterium]